MSGQPQAPAALSPAKEHSVHIELDVSGPQSGPGRFGKQQTVLSLPVPEPLIIALSLYILRSPVSRSLQQITRLEIRCAFIIHFSPLFLSRGGGKVSQEYHENQQVEKSPFWTGKYVQLWNGHYCLRTSSYQLYIRIDFYVNMHNNHTTKYYKISKTHSSPHIK
jgi:hypothetical protein